MASALRVREVRLRVGALAGIATDSLLFCYEIATQDTVLAGSKLIIQELPVVIFCPVCQETRELPGIQRFRCPTCETPSGYNPPCVQSAPKETDVA